MEQSDVHTRYKILQAVYRGCKQRKSASYCLMPDVLGYTYSEMNYQLRYMKTKGLLTYTPRMLMRGYNITLLPPGKNIVEEFETAFFSEDLQRDETMENALAPLR